MAHSSAWAGNLLFNADVRTLPGFDGSQKVSQSGVSQVLGWTSQLIFPLPREADVGSCNGRIRRGYDR